MNRSIRTVIFSSHIHQSHKLCLLSFTYWNQNTLHMNNRNLSFFTYRNRNCVNCVIWISLRYKNIFLHTRMILPWPMPGIRILNFSEGKFLYMSLLLLRLLQTNLIKVSYCSSQSAKHIRYQLFMVSCICFHQTWKSWWILGNVPSKRRQFLFLASLFSFSASSNSFFYLIIYAFITARIPSSSQFFSMYIYLYIYIP